MSGHEWSLQENGQRKYFVIMAASDIEFMWDTPGLLLSSGHGPKSEFFVRCSKNGVPRKFPKIYRPSELLGKQFDYEIIQRKGTIEDLKIKYLRQ